MSKLVRSAQYRFLHVKAWGICDVQWGFRGLSAIHIWKILFPTIFKRVNDKNVYRVKKKYLNLKYVTKVQKSFKTLS